MVRVELLLPEIGGLLQLRVVRGIMLRLLNASHPIGGGAVVEGLTVSGIRRLCAEVVRGQGGRRRRVHPRARGRLIPLRRR